MLSKTPIDWLKCSLLVNCSAQCPSPGWLLNCPLDNQAAKHPWTNFHPSLTPHRHLVNFIKAVAPEKAKSWEDPRGVQGYCPLFQISGKSENFGAAWTISWKVMEAVFLTSFTQKCLQAGDLRPQERLVALVLGGLGTAWKLVMHSLLEVTPGKQWCMELILFCLFSSGTTASALMPGLQFILFICDTEFQMSCLVLHLPLRIQRNTWTKLLKRSSSEAGGQVQGH